MIVNCQILVQQVIGATMLLDNFVIAPLHNLQASQIYSVFKLLSSYIDSLFMTQCSWLLMLNLALLWCGVAWLKLLDSLQDCACSHGLIHFS